MLAKAIETADQPRGLKASIPSA